eukprot:TRINITY_DN395_c4_g1_i4.p1 TRINITY_DN395_c4_g1~~TRINITY_DN395_c4_g1_i4.p1  ORF type:complete len:803 (-),score=137.51 TRINITY_DN395_c4_g1_i4:108-2516(-)
MNVPNSGIRGTAPAAGGSSAKLTTSQNGLATDTTRNYHLKTLQTLTHGDHLCALFHDDDEQATFLVEYFRGGFERDEKVLWLVDPSELKDRVLAHMRKAFDLDDLVARGDFTYLSVSEKQCPGGPGTFDLHDCCAVAISSEEQALAEGYTGLRAVGEPTWLCNSSGRERDSREFVDYESWLSSYTSTRKCKSILLCMYNLQRWESEFLLNVLTVHPLAMLGSEIFQNFYHIPRDEFFCNDLPSSTLSQWLRNLEDRKNAEEALIEAKERAIAAVRAKSAFLATVSHEIRTPLNGIIGMTDVLLETKLDPEQRECLGVVKSSGAHLLTVINDVLDSARIDSGKLALEYVPFDLRTCIKEAISVCKVAAQLKGLTLRLEVHPQCPVSVMGDMTRLRQILVNLLGNAIKFSHKGSIGVVVEVVDQAPIVVRNMQAETHDASRLTLDMDSTDRSSAELSGEQSVLLRFAVSDEGIGIPSDHVAKIFETFTQVDLSTTRNYGGTGLGLSICKHLVETFGGEISVQSVLHHGSTFSFTFPTTAVIVPVPSAQVEGSPAQEDKPEYDKLSILVAEDNKINQIVVRKMLSTFGCQLKLAVTGLEAFQMAVAEPFDLILMDLHMPKVDGWQAIRMIREAGLKVPIYIMSAGIVKPSELKDVDGVLPKPFTLAALQDTLSSAMEAALQNPQQPHPQQSQPHRPTARPKTKTKTNTNAHNNTNPSASTTTTTTTTTTHTTPTTTTTTTTTQSSSSPHTNGPSAALPSTTHPTKTATKRAPPSHAAGGASHSPVAPAAATPATADSPAPTIQHT